jgi:hypothetical protein
VRSCTGVVAAVGGHHSGAEKGPTMELLVLAIIVIVGFGLYRYMQRWVAR